MKKILLIDDDHDLSQLTKTTLVKNGYDVAVFNQAEAAISQAREQKPDLILMDVMLPGMNGAEAVKELKSDPNLKEVPVIFLTALVSNQEKSLEESGLNVDGLNYKTVGKPYEIDQLLEIVGGFIN